MNQHQLALVNLLIILLLGNLNPLLVEGVFAGSGRYGYGRRELQLHSKQILCKRLKSFCDAFQRQKRKSKDSELQKRSNDVMRGYLRAAGVLMKLRRLREMEGATFD